MIQCSNCACLKPPSAQTGQVLNIASAGEAAGLKARTAENYTRLLEALFLVHRLAAGGRTLRARAVATPELRVIDPELAGRLLRLTPEKLARRDATAMQEFGHLVETFVITEMMKQVSWLDDNAGTGHWFTHDGAEVDLIIERRGAPWPRARSRPEATSPPRTSPDSARDAMRWEMRCSPVSCSTPAPRPTVRRTASWSCPSIGCGPRGPTPGRSAGGSAGDGDHQDWTVVAPHRVQPPAGWACGRHGCVPTAARIPAGSSAKPWAGGFARSGTHRSCPRTSPEATGPPPREPRLTWRPTPLSRSRSQEAVGGVSWQRTHARSGDHAQAPGALP